MFQICSYPLTQYDVSLFLIPLVPQNIWSLSLSSLTECKLQWSIGIYSSVSKYNSSLHEMHHNTFYLFWRKCRSWKEVYIWQTMAVSHSNITSNVVSFFPLLKTTYMNTRWWTWRIRNIFPSLKIFLGRVNISKLKSDPYFAFQNKDSLIKLVAEWVN